MLFYPPRCALCDARGDDGLDLCAACRADLPALTLACARCALALPIHLDLCPACRRKPPPFAAACAALRYEAPVDWLVTRLKFHRCLSHARILGALLAERVGGAAVEADVVLPVPLHPSRLRERGFNQAHEIARVFGQRLGLPLAPNLARRTRATGHQLGLSAAARAANLRGAFAAAPQVAGKRIAIVDDVITTGHTAAELARTLKRAGAETVVAWAAARA